MTVYEHSADRIDALAAAGAAISVAVLTYNSERTITACLWSLVGQTAAPAEILIVDDDSTDDTLRLVGELAERMPCPLRVLRNGSHNISRGRNIAISEAACSRIAFLDSDAYAEADWVMALHEAFSTDPSPAVVGGGVRLAHASSFAEALAVNDETVRALFTRGPLLVNGCNMAVDRDLIGGARFDPDFVHAEDVEFIQRACSRHPWMMAEGALVEHESRSTPKAYLRQMYRYGAWKVRYAARTGDHRPIDYVPTGIIVATVAVAPVWPLALLAVPVFCMAETGFVLVYRRPSPRMTGRLLLGWAIKNLGWGVGVLSGFAHLGLSAVRPGRGAGSE